MMWKCKADTQQDPRKCSHGLLRRLQGNLLPKEWKIMTLHLDQPLEQNQQAKEGRFSGEEGWVETAAGFSHDSCRGRFPKASTGYKINSALGFRPEWTGRSWQWDNTTKGAARTPGGETSHACMCVRGHEHRHEPWSFVSVVGQVRLPLTWVRG